MTLKLTYQDVYSRIGEYMGVGSAPTGSNLLKIANIVKRGYRRYLMPIDLSTGKTHSWKFLEATTTLSTIANQDTYELPIGFEGFVSKLQYVTPNIGGPTEKSLEYVVGRKSETTGSGTPMYYAKKTGDFDKVNGQRYQIVFYPTPSAALEYYYSYTFTPPAPVNDADVFVGDALSSEALLEICLAVAEVEKYDSPGAQNPQIHIREAERLLQMAIGADKRKSMVPNMGQITDGVYANYIRYNIINDQSGNQIVPM